MRIVKMVLGFCACGIVPKAIMYRRALVVIVLVVLEATASAQGVVAFPQCGGGFLGLTYLMARSETAAVFSGIVTTARQPDAAAIVTFDVDRVWKGAISKRTVVNRPNPVTPDSRQCST